VSGDPPAEPDPDAAEAKADLQVDVDGDVDGDVEVDEAGEVAGDVDAVRAALNRARARAAAAGRAPGEGTRARSPRRARGDVRSGARPDARDPQPVAASIERLVAERGWTTPVAVGGVMGRWDAVVGPDVAAHCAPESFADGVLTVRADSSAWATQVRLLVPTLLRRLGEVVGEGTVTKVVVRGPSGPTWRRGPRVAPGSQGPRDTYG
jgi:predicted nucleic acid-binding Zn ribbon protein